MDKVTQYSKIIQQLLEEIAAMAPSEEGVENQIIMDDKRGHFLLYSVGWEKKRWIYGSYVHIDLKPDGKVWLQHDGTSLRVAEELHSRGIPKQDMVIGFQDAQTRAHMGEYAVA
ncbi:MAG: XisI protein [Saprospiraceae bacterium]